MGGPVFKQYSKVWALVKLCTVPKADLNDRDGPISSLLFSPESLLFGIRRKTGLGLHWAGVHVDQCEYLKMLQSGLFIYLLFKCLFI